MRVGFIGIGSMGTTMAASVVRAGHEVTVFDAIRDRATGFAETHRCRAASGLAQIADNEFVITMLPTGAIVRQVLLEDESGAFMGAVRPGTVVIDMTSGVPALTRALGAELASRGAVLLDAPISKRMAAFDAAMPREAASTALVIMIGGDDPQAIARAKPLLAQIGDTLFETGPLGSGHATKALNNYASAANYAAVCEAVLVGKRLGLDPARTIDIINVSTGRSFGSEVMLKNRIGNDAYATGFTLGLMAKDVQIAVDLARESQLDAPVLRAVNERWASARSEVGADRDVTAAVLAWDKNAERP